MAKLPLDPNERYAVLVIDMQRDGLDVDGAIYFEGGYDLTSNIQRLTGTARQAAIPVLHSQHEHRADFADFGIAGYFEELSCVRGTPGAEFVAGMEPDESDIVIKKQRYSAFHGTELDLVLRGLDVKGLFICGVLTDACVLSTVVDARALDYKVWMVEDALSGSTPHRHENALDILGFLFADVVSTEWALESLSNSIVGVVGPPPPAS